jgi:hypothetical protein
VIKLKIGDNFLVTSNEDRLMREFIVYMMSSFKQQGQTVLGLDIIGHNYKVPLRKRPSGTMLYDDYVKFIKTENIQDLWILTAMPSYTPTDKAIFKLELHDFLRNLKTALPNLKCKVIKLNDRSDSREYNLGQKMYDALKADNTSILHYIDKLDEYKHLSNRYKAIPAELKVINESIKKLSKVKKVTDRNVTLPELSYLNMIDDAQLEGNSLVLTLKPLPIYTSEPLGMYIPEQDFRNNPYLYEAAKYIYQGCHFGMVGTRIRVNTQFRPEFIETLDHSFDQMFEVNNWSNIGYLHFGKGHLCGGEFNDVMAHTAEYGLEYYFMCLKQYLTTANIRDYAGRKVWWYPIYDKDDNLVYCAGFEILRNWLIDNYGTGTASQIKDLPIKDFIQWVLDRADERYFMSLRTNYTSSNTGNYNGKEDTFLKVCQEKDPEIYEMIMKGANNNG